MKPFFYEIPAELLEEPPEPPRWAPGRRGAGFAAGVGVANGSAMMGLREASGGAFAAARGRETSAPDAFRLGEDATVHAAFGEGVVTALEPDGVIVVRFADDGSERKLMAEYAPVSRR